MTPGRPALVRVEPVVERSQLDTFIDVPWRVYGDDPNWVPPLKSDMRQAFDPSRHPFHRHSEAQAYVAWRGEEPVGRICAIRNRNHEAFHDEPVGFFGFFECLDDQEAADALLDEVRDWLAARGLRTVRGPTSFSTNEVTGLFVEGDDGPPAVMMPYNPPYYPRLLETWGLSGARDLFAWLIEGSAPEYLVRAEELVRRRTRARVRPLHMSLFEAELDSVRELYNSAWEKNWGFVPMTDAEFEFMAAELKPLVDPNLALFVETEAGEPVAFALALPDYNEVLKRLNGRLTPLGMMKALWYRRRIRKMRVLILGVREEYRGKGLDALLYLELFRNGRERGIRRAEMSWILEGNEKMNAALERMGARMYRRYRLYETDIRIAG